MFKDFVSRDFNSRETFAPLLERVLTFSHLVSPRVVAVRVGDDAECELFVLLRIQAERRAEAIVAEGPPRVVPHFGAETQLRVTIDQIDAAVAGLYFDRGLLLAASRLRFLDVGEVGAHRPREIA